MTDSRHIDPEDLALHAMQLLDDEEALDVQTHLDRCSECRETLAAIQDDLAIVSLSAPSATPSPEARERFLGQVAREKRLVPIGRGVEPMGREVVPVAAAPRMGGKLVPWLGWAVAAGVALSAATLYHDREQLQATVSDQSAQLKAETAQMTTMSNEQTRARAIMDALTDSNAVRVTLNTPAAARPVPQGRATYVAGKGTLIFTANNLEPLPIAKVYELWLIPADGTAPIPAGTFRPDGRGNASVVMPPLPKGVEAKAFGVTMEAEGGSMKPTAPILLVGAA